MCSDSESDLTPAPKDVHDCSKPKLSPPPLDDGERWGLGQPGSETVRQSASVTFDRRESRPYFVR